MNVHGRAEVKAALSPSSKYLLKGADDRPYQNKAIKQFLEWDGRGILVAGTGAGKTIISLTVAKGLGYRRLLILATRFSGLLTWKKNLPKYGFGDPVIVSRWTKDKRLALWQSPPAPNEVQVVVALYQTVARDADIIAEFGKFDFILCDEAHRLLRRPKNVTYKKLKSICRTRLDVSLGKQAAGRARVIFMTATPQARGPEDLWTMLHILAPHTFKSYWEFVNRYCVMEETDYGNKIIGTRESALTELRLRLRGFVHAIKDSELSGWVPKRVRKLLPVELGKRERKIYKSLAQDLMAELPEGGLLLAPSPLAKLTRLRQLLTCPRYLHPALPIGAGIEEIVAHALDNDRHAVIFSDFPGVFPEFQKYLEGLGHKVWCLRGGMSVTDIEITIASFERCKDSKTPSWILNSIPFAESYDLLSPSTGYMIGFAWDQNANMQAEGRLLRGEKSHCNFFYVCHEKTVDTEVLEVLTNKTSRTNITFSADEIRKILENG